MNQKVIDNCILCECKEHEIIWMNDTFIIAYDTYPIGIIHVLIIPKEHVLSSAKVKQRKQLISLVSIVSNCMQELFESDVIVYEHGNYAPNLTGLLSVDHAHVHIVPVNSSESFMKEFSKDIPGPQYASDLYLAIENLGCESQYHLVGSMNTQWLHTNYSLPSQYFRKKYAESLAEVHWNWKDNPTWFIENKKQNKQHREKYSMLLNQKLASELSDLD